MRPLNIPGMVPFGKPKDWDDERDGKCFTLPVMVTDRTCLSVWELNSEERRRIAAGENITLSIVGGQPPVLLGVAAIYDAASPKPPVAPAAPHKTGWWRWLWHCCLDFGRCRGDYHCSDCGRVQR